MNPNKETPIEAQASMGKGRMTEADEDAPLAVRRVTFGHSDAVPPRAKIDGGKAA